MKKIITLYFALATSIYSSTGSLGQVIYTKGIVKINDTVAKKGSSFDVGARFQVAGKSLAIVKLPEGSKVKISENTSLVIKNFKSKLKPTLVQITKGDAFFKVLKSKLVDKKEKFVVKNKFTSMGVRGTSFFVSSGVSKSNDLWMCVEEGIVAVKNKADKKLQLVKGGEGIVSKKGEKTSKPRPLAWTKKLNWNMNPESGNVKNEVSIQEAYTDLLDQDYD